jgi:citrate synthase
MDRKTLFRRKTSISYKTEEKTVMRGFNLSDLAEEGYSFYDALFILYQNRIPSEKEEKMLKYEMGVFMEHSMSPSAVASIGVSAGRPNLPVAVAAAVSTFGGVHGPGAAHGYMLNKYLKRGLEEGKSVDEIAKTLVDDYMDAKRPVMGLGQPQHIDSDPRAEPIHLKQEELGLKGIYLELQRAVEKYFHQRRKKEGRSYVGVNVVGSGNTALMEIGFSPNAGWCIGSVARGFSCAAHALFNMKRGRAWGASRNEPMVQMIDLSMIKYVGPEDRIVPKQEERQEYAKKMKEEGEYKKWVI